MQIHLVRDPSIVPGNSTWLELPDSVMFVASTDGMTQDGAECLEACWQFYVDRGLWQWAASPDAADGCRVRVTYHREPTPSGDVAEVWMSANGLVDVWLDPDHFVEATVAGLERMARTCAGAQQWTCHPQPAEQVAS